MHNDVYRGVSSVAVMGDRRFLDRLFIGALLSRLLRRRPHDAVATMVAGVATLAIVINALWLQSGTHPAPFFPAQWRPVAGGDTTGSVAAIAPRPQAAAVETPKAEVPVAPRTAAQIASDIQRELTRRKFYDGPVDGVYGAKTDAAIREFEHAAGLKASVAPDEALLRSILRSPIQSPPPPATTNAKRGSTANAAAAAPSKKVVALQRALADFGYGQLAPTGVADPATKTAIERFERERKLPITGQVSDRLMREVAAMTGRPLE